mgnify:CR=1 FL=1
MLDRDFFDHDNPDGKDPGDRIRDAGYVASTWGENIAWQGSTGAIDLTEYVHDLHAGLFQSPGHRRNILNADFRELGPGVRAGVFTSGGRNWNVAMLTEDFGKRAGHAFLTGVAFSDAGVADEFYSIGEGLDDVTVTARAADGGTPQVVQLDQIETPGAECREGGGEALATVDDAATIELGGEENSFAQSGISKQGANGLF